MAIRLQEPDSAYRKRWPHLLKAMGYVACLSEGEAISALRAYFRGDPYACEAVAHFGGPEAVLRAAIEKRSALFSMLYRERIEQEREQAKCRYCYDECHRWMGWCLACPDPRHS
jgi:hypothetical protein